VAWFTDRNLLLRAARTQRCAGEGELVFGLTKHVASLSRAGPGINTLFAAIFAHSWGVAGGFWARSVWRGRDRAGTTRRTGAPRPEPVG
jgi:hypothetical protein